MVRKLKADRAVEAIDELVKQFTGNRFSLAPKSYTGGEFGQGFNHVSKIVVGILYKHGFVKDPPS